MIIASLFVSTLLGTLQTSTWDWVVKDTLLPLSSSNDKAFEWGARHPFGDWDGDGTTDTLLSGRWIPPVGSGQFGVNRLILEVNSSAALRWSSYSVTHSGAHDWALLNSPSGARLIAVEISPFGSERLIALDLPSLNQVGVLSPPTNLPGGFPDPAFMSGLAPCGDINQDGFEDFFWSRSQTVGSGEAYFGLCDGASLDGNDGWTHAEFGSAAAAVSWEPGKMPDFSGDGIPDFLVGTVRALGFGISEHSWFLLSGADGSTIWRQDGGVGTLVLDPMIGPDLNSDGWPDAALWQQDHLRLISPKDGSEIWKTPWTDLEQSLPAGWSLQETAIGENTFSTGLKATDPPIILQPFLRTELSTLAVSMDFAIFSTSDGTLLGTAEAPENLEPWDENIPLNGDVFMSYIPWPYGDFDNDGLMEYSVWVADKANSPAWAVALGVANYSKRLVILGQRTLFTEETHDVLAPTPVTFNLICPSGPGKDFVVLLSTAFSERHGLNIGQWKTYLGASSALDLTLTSRALSGTLDAEGQGSTYAMVPPNPNLIGQTLYSRGLILNPAGSADPVWSMTSLGQTLLQ